MKKNISKISIILILLIVLAGCGGDKNTDKVFTYENMEITLPKNFKEHEMERYNKVYSTDKVAIYVIKESKNEYKKLKEINLNEYFELVKTANSKENAESKKLDNIPIFTYTISPKEDEKYSYYVSCHESEDAFWTIEFSTLEEDYKEMEESFDKWCKSITFK